MLANTTLASPIRFPFLIAATALVGGLFGFQISLARSGEVRKLQAFGTEVYELVHDQTRVKIAPTAGANVYSIQIDGVEYLHQPESPAQLPGVSCGVPILYPTPNRVRGGTFTFEGTRVQLNPRAEADQPPRNHIHGLVNRHAWEVTQVESDDEKCALECVADFGADTMLGETFPFEHVLRLRIEVRSRSVRWTYQVDATNSSKRVPFGFALHPYFRYQGARSSTYLTIPATHWMEATNQLPSGELIPASKLRLPLGEPFSLAGQRLDDVYYGLKSSRPTRIDFRETHRAVHIHASDSFTHLVVWTPDREYFGIESQTCSTDAHNLHAAGHEQAAHLQICPAKETRSGWVEYRFPSPD